MIFDKQRHAIERAVRAIIRHPNRFLDQVTGVIHVGANTGQERFLYQNRGLSVFWIEPIPHVFEQLEANIASIATQFAVQALIADKDGESHRFNIANNNGASSSLLAFKDHADVWPEVGFSETIDLYSKTLTTAVEENGIDLTVYNALVMDTQGTELLVLKGAEPILRNFSFIKAEVADFESYAGCCQFNELDKFLVSSGFRRFSRRVFAAHPSGGKYYDVTYRRQS